MKNKFITFGIILICFVTIAVGVQTFASGTGMSLKALKGPLVIDLYIIYDDSALNNADRVKITAYYFNASKKFTEVYSNIAIINGVSTIPLANLDQNETIVVEVTIGSGKSRMDISNQTMVKLRPDLSIQSLNAPVSALNISYFNVDLNVTELNRDTGANFTILIKEGELILASKLSQVVSGGSVSLSIPVLIDQVGPHTLSAVIVNSDPEEYSTSNNQQDFTIEITRLLQKPDLAIQSLNAPASALNTSYFNVDVNVTELNGETGANFTLLIKEGEVVLASELSQVAPGGAVLLSIPVLIDQVGPHTLSAVIVNSDPAEYSTSNNQANFSIEITRPLQKPDLAIQSLNAPASALNTSYFNVDVNVTELNGDTGANFTLLIKEGEVVLASELSQVIPDGSVALSIPVLIDQVGPHTLSAVIVSSDPEEYSTSNNQQDFTIEITRPLQKPDLTIQSLNAPASALNISYFNVDVNVTELNGETGANFTLLIKEGELILASELSQVVPDGSIALSIPVLIDQVGPHTLSAVIANSEPSEDSLNNNVQNFIIEIISPMQKPDLTIQSLNAPASALNTSYFNVDVNVTELNGETGANFTLLIKEGEVILASELSQLAPGGSVSLSIPVLIDQVGTHNLSALIANSDPSEDSIANNVQNFTIKIRPTLNPVNYTTWYYSQVDNYRNNKNLNSAADGGTHIEVSEYIENKISERLFYNLTINSELIFPIDSLFIQLYNESGVVEERENTNIVPTKIENGKTIASLYYPDTGSTITITAKSGSTEIKLEKKAKYQQTLSSGYNYYSQSMNSTWNSGFINQTGTLMNARSKTIVYIEVIDDGSGYGGTETMNLTLPIHQNSTWTDTGVSGYRNIATYYTKQAGRTSI